MCLTKADKTEKQVKQRENYSKKKNRINTHLTQKLLIGEIQ